VGALEGVVGCRAGEGRVEPKQRPGGEWGLTKEEKAEPKAVKSNIHRLGLVTT